MSAYLSDAVPILLTALGALAFLTGVLTELTKNLGPLRRLPTDAQVIATALLLSLGALLAYLELGGDFRWYLLTASVVLGLLAAFIAMYGWAAFWDLAERLGRQKAGPHE